MKFGISDPSKKLSSELKFGSYRLNLNSDMKLKSNFIDFSETAHCMKNIRT